MLFERLPAPDERPLAHAPVQIATFQLDFPEERALKPRDGIAWQEQLQKRGHKTPRLISVKQQSISVSIAPRNTEKSLAAERAGWQVFFEDGVSNAALFASAVNVEHFNYDTYDKLRRDALDAYDAAAELLAPQVQQRVALAYSNALSNEAATSVDYWRGKVRPPFLGIAHEPALAEGLSRSFSMLSWSDGDYAADMQIAIQPDQVYTGCTAFVFQTDIARRGMVPLTRPNLEATIDSLHTIALKLFAAVLEPKYIDELRNDMQADLRA